MKILLFSSLFCFKCKIFFFDFSNIVFYQLANYKNLVLNKFTAL